MYRRHGHRWGAFSDSGEDAGEGSILGMGSADDAGAGVNGLAGEMVAVNTDP
jgi:hypothetical protein